MTEARKKEGKKTIVQALEEITETLKEIQKEIEGINKQIGFRNGYDR